MKESHTDHTAGHKYNFFVQKQRIFNESSASNAYNAYKQNTTNIDVKLGLLRLAAWQLIHVGVLPKRSSVSLYLHKPVCSQGDLLLNKIISVILTVSRPVGGVF